MEKVWLKSYPAGMPAEIDVNAYDSLIGVLDESVRLYGERTAFICMGKGISYLELDRKSRDFAAYLQGVLDLKRRSGCSDDAECSAISRVFVWGVARGVHCRELQPVVYRC